MYPLGRQFEVDYTRSKSDDKTFVKGNNFRITVITERVVRLEYSPSGSFVDRPTQLIMRRDLGYPEYQVKQDTQFVEIMTKYFHLTYVKRQPFVGTKVDPMKNLKITLLSHERDRNKDWYYGHAEARNMNGNFISVDVDVNKVLQRGLYSLDGFASFDDSRSKVIMEDGTLANPPEDHIDVYVFMYDRDFKQALFDYFKMTGSPAMIPRYALGNWWSRNITYDDHSTTELLKKFEKKKIPFAVMLFDHDWHYRNVGDYTGLKTGYTFNSNLFRNPKAMIDKFHQRGIHVGLCIDPTEGFYPHEQYYKQASEFLGVSDNKIILFDPLNPKILDVWFKAFLHPLENYGIDFFWNDYRGTSDPTNLWTTNHYLYLDSGRNSARRSMILARNGIYAPHLYPVLYGGSSEVSWEALKKLPFQYLNAANIGVSWWSHDVGGNHGGIEESELYIRYLEPMTKS